MRDLPGTHWGITATLQRSALVQVVLGPILTGGFGWYLVRDADPAAPAFREGWLAAGFNPNAFVAPQPSATPAAGSPAFVAGYADVTDGDFGPFRLEGSTALRWTIAVRTGQPAGTTCQFSGSLCVPGRATGHLPEDFDRPGARAGDGPAVLLRDPSPADAGTSRSTSNPTAAGRSPWCACPSRPAAVPRTGHHRRAGRRP